MVHASRRPPIAGAPLAALVLAGCLFGPYDGQVLSSTTETVYPWGVYPAEGAEVTLSARWPTDGQFYPVTSTTTTNGYCTAFDTDWYYWSTGGVAIPWWAWRSGVTGWRAEVRATSGSSVLYSYPASGMDCVLEQDQAGADMTTAAEVCKADTSPSAFLFTSDYRGMPTFAPQDPVDYPRELEHSRVEDIQGVASTTTDWFFAYNGPALVRMPMTADVGTHDAWDDASVAEIPAALGDLGYDHHGDPDEYLGHLYVPVEDGDENVQAAIAQFDLDLNLRGHATLPGIKAPWVAIDPTTGLLYMSAFCDVTEVEVYTMSFADDGTLVGLTLLDRRTLWDHDSVPVAPLQRIQGGAFSDRGNLYLVSDGQYGGECDLGTAGVYGFEATTFRKEVFFDVPYDPGFEEELEGIDIRDVTGLETPGIAGQLHVVMVDNDDPWYDFENDDFYFKHYLAAAGELGFL